MTLIYIINLLTIVLLIGLSVMLILKGNKRKNALWHYYISCKDCGRKVHITFGFLNMLSFWSDIQAKCLLKKEHKITLDGKKYKETGAIRSSFCWYFFLASLVLIGIIIFLFKGMVFIMQTIPDKSVLLCLMLISAALFMVSLVYYYFCRSMQTTAFCFNEVGKDYDGEIISAKGKTAYVKIGDAKFNGTVFSKFKGYEKESRVKLHVTLPDVTINESDAVQAVVEQNEITKAYTIYGVLDTENSVIHSSIDFMIDPYKAENASELNGKNVKIVVPQIGLDIRKI